MKTSEMYVGKTLIDESDLKTPSSKTVNDINREEAENILVAKRKYFGGPKRHPSRWFFYRKLFGIHKAMFCDVRPWAGKIRQTITNIGVKPGLIPHYMSLLCDDVNFWSTEPTEFTFLEQAARIHHRLVWIHPFKDGNGRAARFIGDLYLRSWDCSFPMWPTELMDVGNEKREAYLQAQKSADTEEDYEPLIKLMQEWGAKDFSFADLMLSPFYQKQLTKNQLLSLLKAGIRRGYSVNQTSLKNHHPLHLAIKKLPEGVPLLLEAGADLKFRDRSGLDSFELAIFQRNLKLAKCLCDRGYPYIPRQPPSAKLLAKGDILAEFDRIYFR